MFRFILRRPSKLLDRRRRPDRRKRRGASAERWVAWRYRLRGYRIIARNLRLVGVEVDLICWRRGHLVVVEVKSRRRTARGHFDRWESSAVTPRQAARLLRVAEFLESRHSPIGIRVDFAFVQFGAWLPTIEVVTNALGRPESFSSETTLDP